MKFYIYGNLNTISRRIWLYCDNIKQNENSIYLSSAASYACSVSLLSCQVGCGILNSGVQSYLNFITKMNWHKFSLNTQAFINAVYSSLRSWSLAYFQQKKVCTYIYFKDKIAHCTRFEFSESVHSIQSGNDFLCKRLD